MVMLLGLSATIRTFSNRSMSRSAVMADARTL